MKFPWLVTDSEGYVFAKFRFDGDAQAFVRASGRNFYVHQRPASIADKWATEPDSEEGWN